MMMRRRKLNAPKFVHESSNQIESSALCSRRDEDLLGRSRSRCRNTDEWRFADLANQNIRQGDWIMWTISAFTNMNLRTSKTLSELLHRSTPKYPLIAGQGRCKTRSTLMTTAEAHCLESTIRARPRIEIKPLCIQVQVDVAALSRWTASDRK